MNELQTSIDELAKAVDNLIAQREALVSALILARRFVVSSHEIVCDEIEVIDAALDLCKPKSKGVVT